MTDFWFKVRTNQTLSDSLGIVRIPKFGDAHFREHFHLPMSRIETLERTGDVASALITGYFTIPRPNRTNESVWWNLTCNFEWIDLERNDSPVFNRIREIVADMGANIMFERIDESVAESILEIVGSDVDYLIAKDMRLASEDNALGGIHVMLNLTFARAEWN